MGVELVTAYTGTNHVSSSQDGALYAGIVGLDNYVFTTGQKLQATMEDANTLVVASGNGLINGRHFEVTDTVSFTIPTGSQDMMTSNLAVIRYTKGADSVESVTPLVLTGEPVAKDPQDPAYNEGSILDGVSTVDFPIYRVVTTGISAGEPEQLFDVVGPLSDVPRTEWRFATDGPVVSSWTVISGNVKQGTAITGARMAEIIGRPLDAGDLVNVRNGDIRAAPNSDVVAWRSTSDGGLSVTATNVGGAVRFRVDILYHVP